MSRISLSDLMIDIQDDIEQGELTYQQIASKYNVPIDWVRSAAVDYVDQMNQYDDAQES